VVIRAILRFVTNRADDLGNHVMVDTYDEALVMARSALADLRRKDA